MIARAGAPQSRAGFAGGGVRPPSGAGQAGVTPFRPPSAMAAGGPPGTGRLGTARAPSSYGVERGVGVGLNAQLQVQDRPFTKEGMAGMRTATASRRVVHDRSYHLGQLRGKCSELQRETTNLEEELQQLAKDQQLYHQKQKKVDALKKEVAELRGKLSDYNLAVQLRLGNEDVDVQGVIAETETLHFENQRRSRHVDQVFEEQSSMNKEIAAMEGEILQIETDLNMQLEDDPEKKQYVDAMRMEISQLRDQIMRLTQQKNDYLNKTKGLQSEVSSDPVRAAAFQLTQEKVQLLQRKAELTGEVDPNSEGGSVEDERTRLLRETREKKAEIDKMQRRLLEIDEAVSSLRSQFDVGADEGDADSQFMKLLASDRQITEEIEEFPEREQEKMRRIRALQEKITDHLTEVSTGLAMKSNLPSSSEFEGIKKELLFKQQKAMQAASTADRIQNKELNDLLRDLKNLENLESRIEMQRKYNEDKLGLMRSEMGKYEDLDGLKREAESSMKSLDEQLEMFGDRFNKISARVSMAASELEADEKRLNNNDLHKAMQQHLKAAKFRETNVFTLEEFINSEGAETNYHPVAEKCLSKVQELNTMIQKSLSGYV